MDLDREFIRAIVREGKPAILAAIDRGVSAEDHLYGDGKKAWEYLVSHWKEYREVPSIDVIEAKVVCGLDGSSSESARFFLDEIFKRRLFFLCRDGTENVAKSLDERDPQAAAEAWSEIHHKIQSENLTVKKVESLLALGKQVLSGYEDAKAGVRGIPTPWPTMDDQTLGWWPEDLVMYIARLGIGKTWLTIISAHKAWVEGRKVLFISTEMNKVQIARRFFALHLRLPYDDIRKGRLGEFVEEKFYAGINEVIGGSGINIVGGDFDYTVDNLGAVVADEQPELLCVDGPYLIKNNGRDRHERVSSTFDDLKSLGIRYGHATLTNLQFNRSAKTGQATTVAAENIGVTDVAAWNASVAYGLMQTDDMMESWQMGIKPLKLREGRGGEFRIRWNHEAMDFSEIEGSGDEGDGEGGGTGDSTSQRPVSDQYEDLPF